MKDCFGDSFKTEERAASWLSLGFEDLVYSIGKGGTGSASTPLDVLIVGSGYGGAVAASELAGATDDKGNPVTVCVLERGREYLPGSFPGSVDDLAGHIRFSAPGASRPRGRLEGLFDLRLGPDVNALVANGLGGGSLINAGVMLRPDPAVLNGLFPAGLEPFYDEAEALLGAKNNQYSEKNAPQKAFALKAFDVDKKHRFVPITVGLKPGGDTTSAGVRLEECIKCGDCATGCNFGAKNSLDLNLLVKAVEKGAAIYTGATVLRIERRHAKDGWIVHSVPTDRAMRDRHGLPLPIHARKLILAAGAYGSPEILMRSRTETLTFSKMLGKKFSTNGDMLAAVYDHNALANAVADEGQPPCEREVGPTITSMIDLRKGDRGFAIQEMNIPGPLRRAFEETVTMANLLRELGEPDNDLHTGTETDYDPCAVNPDKVKRSTIVAIMANDGYLTLDNGKEIETSGTLELAGGADEADGDGAVLVRWPELRMGPAGTANRGVFDKEMEALDKLVTDSKAGGHAMPNPVWRLLPPSMSFLMDDARGPAVTVHPLGGCVIAKDSDDGAVNTEGQVFGGDSDTNDAVFEDLAVLDGSIVPRPLGINPALTITALALRASRILRTRWNLKAPASNPPAPKVRPYYQKKVYERKPAPIFAFAERLSGTARVSLPGDSWATERFVELTIHYQHSALGRLMAKMPRALSVDPEKSYLRVFASQKIYKKACEPDPDATDLEARLDAAALAIDGPRGKSIPLEGRLRFFHREPSTACQRRWRALRGYLVNRGLRDVWDELKSRYWYRVGKKKGSKDTWGERRRGALALASRAGEVRLFEYELDAKPKNGQPPFRIEGRKRLTYGFRTNLWQQLETLTLSRFGPYEPSGSLEIDFKYFAAIQTPLARIFSQPNMPAALIDLGAFMGHVVRIMINIHMWSFRRPDAARPRVPQRLPGVIDRPWYEHLLRCAAPPPAFIEMDVGTLPFGYPVKVRLTRYPRYDSTRLPVLLIHGYSASGTTFAHTAVKPNLVETLWKQGRDVWVVDMRTSSGFLTAAWPWSFEDAALVDIPAAVDRILRETQHEQLDVVAHCMGGAMFSMALLKPPQPGDPFYEERELLPKRIRRVVLSQVGPRVEFSPMNVFRGYVMRYTRHYLGVAAFDFRIQDAPSVAEQLLDRFLSSLKYPPEELAIENPLCFLRDTSYVGTRHRMDSLYARTFSLANLGRGVLDNIDDFFGPLNLATVGQALYFSQEHVITDRNGRNVFLDRNTRDNRWRREIETLTVHAADNGLADKATRDLIDRYFNYEDDGSAPLPERRIHQITFDGCGHQDSLIGKPEVTAPIFDAISDFLEHGATCGKPGANKPFLIVPPWITQRSLTPGGATGTTIGAAAQRSLGDPRLAVIVTVKKNEKSDRYEEVPVDTGLGTRSSQHLYPVKPDKDGWLSIEVPPRLAYATRPVEGLLLLLLYDQPSGIVQNQVAPFAEAIQRVISGQNLTVPTDVGTVPLDHLMALDARPPEVQLPPDMLNLLLELVALFNGIQSIVNPIKDGISRTLRERSIAQLEKGFWETHDRQTSTAELGRTRVLVASCQYPSGVMDAEPAWSGYRRMGKILGAAPEGEDSVLVLVGDQIYSDATAGVFDPVFADDRYRRPHEALFSRPEVNAVLKATPIVTMLDDHEISDNWEPLPESARPRKSLEDGLRAYKDFQRRSGPPFVDPRDDSLDPIWYETEIGGLPIFMADTRTERHPRRAELYDEACIMSCAQYRALTEWMEKAQKEAPSAPKFIACPPMLVPRRLETQREVGVGSRRPAALAGSMRADTWEGYPASMFELLRFIVEKDIRNVIFLSGDEHLMCCATAQLASGRQTIYSIHSSPLYAPFPFANSTAAEFMSSGASFTVPAVNGSGAIDCKVDYEIMPFGSGFAELRATKGIAGWTLEVIYYDAGSTASRSFWLPLRS